MFCHSIFLRKSTDILIGKTSYIFASLLIVNTACAESDEVIVRARKIIRPPTETAAHQSELQGEELRKQLSGTLGETLAQQPGVANASFGPGVGLPVIRGLSGVRVKVLEDDIGVWDASSLGPDHAGGIEPILADRIRIIRGPAALSYGNGAIGGAVAIETQRIPDAIPEGAIQGSLVQRKELLNRDRRGTSALKLDGGAGFIAVHADTSLREQRDTDIPGYAIDEAAIIEQFGVPPKSNTHDYLDNSQARARGGSAGIAAIGEQWTTGLAYSELHNEYGIPLGGHVEGHTHAASGVASGTQSVNIDMRQRRFDYKLGWQGDSRWLDEARLRIGRIDYQHREIENGASGTLFENTVTEIRAEFIPVRFHEFSSNVGVQHIDRDFSAVGAEAFVPLTAQRSTGVWAIGSLDFTRWEIQFGARGEHQRVEQQEPSITLDGFSVMHTPIEHKTFNYHLSAAWSATDTLRLSATLAHAQRAPDIQELLALGSHMATRTFDIGQPKLEQERFDNIDIGIEWRLPWVMVELHSFHNTANDFIYQQNAGFFFDTDEHLIRINCVKLEECLPVQRYRQDDAVFHGYELSVRGKSLDTHYGIIDTTLFSDYVRGRLREGDDIPRLPPLRVGVRIDHAIGAWSNDIALVWNADQNHAGLNETATESYVGIEAGTSLDLQHVTNINAAVFLRGRNLLNSEIRNAVSFLRNYAPERGRSVEAGIDVKF